MSTYVNIDDFKNIRISDFLAALGHFPVIKSGKELFYHSMLRETSRNTPSLSVWDEGGKWIDRAGANHSGIYGGGIIQLALAYWPQLPFKDVLHKINETLNLNPNIISQQPIKITNTENTPREYAFELVKIRPIGTNFILTKYLESRGIIDVAKDHLQEVYYKNHLNKDSMKSYYAIGWKNEHNNFEFATTNGFKSSIGAKGISIIPGESPEHSAVFEGYMDYLSWLKNAKPISGSPTVFVLNSLVQLNKTIERIKKSKTIDLYLDNDLAGKQATKTALLALPQAIDRSNTYKGYKDYNEMLVDQLGSYYHSFKNSTKR